MDIDAGVRLPVLPGEAEPAQGAGPSLDHLRLDPVGSVAELARYRGRGVIAVQAAGGGGPGAESGEGQVQHGGAHLGADAVAVVGDPEPGTGVDLAEQAEVPAVYGLHANRYAIVEYRQR